MDGFRLFCFGLHSRSFPVLTTTPILVHLLMVASLVVAWLCVFYTWMGFDLLYIFPLFY
jgi:hypothetical protein